MMPREPDFTPLLMPVIAGMMYILSTLSGCTEKEPDAIHHGFYAQGDVASSGAVDLQ